MGQLRQHRSIPVRATPQVTTSFVCLSLVANASMESNLRSAHRFYVVVLALYFVVSQVCGAHALSNLALIGATTPAFLGYTITLARLVSSEHQRATLAVLGYQLLNAAVLLITMIGIAGFGGDINTAVLGGMSVFFLQLPPAEYICRKARE